MRIGIYDPYLDDLGGGEKYMMTIASCLSNKHAVSIFWDEKKDIDAIADRFSLDLSRVQLFPNIFSTHTSTFKRFVQTKKFDAMIILSDGSIPFLGAKKLFIHLQQPLKYMQIHDFFEKVKLSRVTKFFSNSYYTKSYIEEKFHIPCNVIYPPVTLYSGNVKKENTIVHVGRFRSVHGADYKKQSVMIATFKHMVDEGLKKWKFILAVSVHEKDMIDFENMKRTAKGYPIAFKVNVSSNELSKIYAKAKIYWHASGYGENLEISPELAEHFGISTVEAMSAGAVPVVINAGGQKEIIENEKNGLLWDNLNELQEKTVKLIKNVTIWKKLSENAKERAKDFSQEGFCERIEELVVV